MVAIAALVGCALGLGPDASARDAEPPATGTVTGVVTVRKNNTLIAPTDVYVYVVDVRDPDGAPPPPKVTIKQHKTQFHPRLAVVPAGTRVGFPNKDKFEHSVFANDPNYFDLGRDRVVDKSYLFELEGEIDVYCDIHPNMSAKVKVMPSSRFVRVSADGTYAIQVPAGKHTLAMWMPDIRDIEKSVTVPAGGSVTLDFKKTTTDAPRPQHTRKDGSPYGRYRD